MVSKRAVLRRADEHFDEIIVQSVIKLALEAPLELWMIEISGVQVEIIGVNRNRFVLELDDNFYAISFCSRGEVQKWMLIQL